MSDQIGLLGLLSWLASRIGNHIGALRFLAGKAGGALLAMLGVTSAALAFRVLDVTRAQFLQVLATISWIEVATIVACVGLLTMVAVPNEAEFSQTAVKATRQFIVALIVLLLFWVVQYALLASNDTISYRACTGLQGDELKECGEKTVPILNLASDIANYATSTLFLTLYVILAKPTTGQRDTLLSARLVLGFAMSALGVALSIATHCFHDYGVALARVKEFPMWWDTGADVYNGLYAGLTMSLFVGRLESRYIGFNGFLVAFLFLYALIQPVYMLLHGGGYLRLGLLVAAFGLKGILILACAWALLEKRLTLYMSEFRHIHEHMGELLRRYEQKTRPLILSHTSRDTYYRLRANVVELLLFIRNMDVGDWYIHSFSAQALDLVMSDGSSRRIDVAHISTPKPVKWPCKLVSGAPATRVELKLIIELDGPVEQADLADSLIVVNDLFGMASRGSPGEGESIMFRVADTADGPLSWIFDPGRMPHVIDE